MLSNTHEGTQWSEWLNNQGIAYFVVNYRLPNGDRSRPIGDVEKAFSQYRLDAKVVAVGYNKFIDPFYPYKPTWIYGWVLATEDYPFNNVEVEL